MKHGILRDEVTLLLFTLPQEQLWGFGQASSTLARVRQNIVS